MKLVRPDIPFFFHGSLKVFHGHLDTRRAWGFIRRVCPCPVRNNTCAGETVKHRSSGQLRWLRSGLWRPTSRALPWPMSGFDGSHAEAAGFAGSAAAAVVARGALCSGRQCRPRPALREPQRQRPMPGQRIVGSGKMARITRELSRKTAAGMQRRPPLCRHSGPVGSIRHPPSILTAGIPGGASHAEKRQGLRLFRGIPRRAD